MKEYAQNINRILDFNKGVAERYDELSKLECGEYYFKRNIIRAVKEFTSHNEKAKLLTVTVNDGVNEFTGKMSKEAYGIFVSYDRSRKSHMSFVSGYFERKDRDKYEDVMGRNYLIPSSWITRITYGKYEVYHKEEK